MSNIYIRYTNELPLSVLGLVKPDADGDYNIYINGRVAENKKREAILHELNHVLEEDCFRTEPAHIIEEKQ